MAKKKKASQNDYKIFVEVLQNGELLSSIAKPFHKPGLIKLTSHPNGELTAPFYPLPTDIDLIKITKRGAEVDLDPNWEGFTTYEGRIEDISSHRKTQYTHIMKQGDYGSIAYNDLRVLIRVGKERPKRLDASVPTGEYRGPLLGLWFSSITEYKTIGIGFLASAWIFASIVIGLMNRPDTRPQQLADLKPVYTLPFIYPRHLELIPEAMQHHLNRKNLISSVFSYYNNFTATVLAYQSKPSPFIFPSSFDYYQDIYERQKSKINEIAEQQYATELKYIEDHRHGFIYIPSILGETLDQKLIWLKEKIKIAHASFASNLKLRRDITTAFHQDQKYLFEQYQSVNRFEKPKEYTPWKMSLDEKTMYAEAKELAKIAALQQKEMKRQRQKITELTPENSRPIAIAPENSKISFLSPENFHQLNKKIASIQASTFDLRKSDLLKEPLRGKINPQLIGKTISKNSFELKLCFELALRRNQNLSGIMEWQWRLDSRGKISEIELISSSIKDRTMIRCVRKKIAGWKFPRPRHGSIQIRHPFSFSRAKG